MKCVFLSVSAARPSVINALMETFRVTPRRDGARKSSSVSELHLLSRLIGPGIRPVSLPDVGWAEEDPPPPCWTSSRGRACKVLQLNAEQKHLQADGMDGWMQKQLWDPSSRMKKWEDCVHHQEPGGQQVKGFSWLLKTSSIQSVSEDLLRLPGAEAAPSADCSV